MSSSRMHSRPSRRPGIDEDRGSSVCPEACRIKTQNAVCAGVPVHCVAAAASGVG